MENNSLSSPCSISVWPSNKNLANEIGIPIIVDYRPFDENVHLMDLSEKCSSFPKCSYCSAYVTSLFVFSKDKISQCPYCGNDFILPKAISFLPYQNFKVEKKLDRFSFYLCFIIDLDCSPENLAKSKENFSIALKSLLPDTFFMVAFIKNGRFHFIMMFNNNPKIISFNSTSSLFNKIIIKSFLNNIKIIETINNYVMHNLTVSKNREIHEIVDFSPLFENCPSDIFIKFVMFSPNHLSEKCGSLLSFDWVSPVTNSNFKKIDGFYLNSQEIPNVDFQIQSMVQRYRNSPFAINCSTQIFYSKQLEISPSSFQIKSVRCGSSFPFTISYSRHFLGLKEVHLQFVSKYVIISPYEANSKFDNKCGYNCEMKVVSRLQVNSYIFQTSKDILPILRTVNPVILKKSFTSQHKEIIFIKKLLELYKEKVTDALPGAPSNSLNMFDRFFLILPNLQLLLSLHLTKNKLFNSAFIIEKENEYVQFCPSLSFWSGQDDKIEEVPISSIDSDEAFKYPPIVVVDSCTSIEIYMDENLKHNSNLSNEIKRKIQMRFPVPTVQRRSREALILNLREETGKFKESVKANLDPLFKSQ